MRLHVCREGQLTHLFFPVRVGRGYGPGWTVAVVVSPSLRMSVVARQDVRCGKTRSLLWQDKMCVVARQDLCCGKTRSLLWRDMRESTKGRLQDCKARQTARQDQLSRAKAKQARQPSQILKGQGPHRAHGALWAMGPIGAMGPMVSKNAFLGWF